MEPEIRYTTTADGVSIAYYTMGEGLPLVVASGILWNNLQYQEIREFHRGGKGLGRGLQFVRYDARGTGLSDRHTLDFSMEARQLDLEAVVERLRLARFAVLGVFHGATTAVAYAARHPERVSHLILMGGYARWRDQKEHLPDFDAHLAQADLQWERYTLLIANMNMGFSDSEAARRRAARMRESITLEGFRAYWAAQNTIDVIDLLPGIAVPTLVMYPRGNPVGVEHSRKLASNIASARLATFTEGANAGDEWARVIEDFIGVNHDARTPAPPMAGTGTAVILFTDIVASTALTERMGDAAFRDASRALDDQLRTAIRDAGGTPIEGKVLGDGVMAVFTSASQAIAAARRCIELSAESELQLHVGLHAGDVISEKGNVYGGAVNIASRVCGHSAPGEVLVSATVRELARTSAGVEFDDHGDQEMKGVGDAVRVYAVRWR